MKRIVMCNPVEKNKFCINLDILKKHFKVIEIKRAGFSQYTKEDIEKIKDADYIFCWNTVAFPEIMDFKKMILFQKESPVTKHRIWTYKNFDKFHTVITHYPKEKNEIRFTDNSIVFPWSPNLWADEYRKDTKLKNRGIFYAGKRNDNYAKIVDQFKDIYCLYDVRAKMVSEFSKYPESRIYGRGWNIPNLKKGSAEEVLYDGKEGTYEKLKFEDIRKEDCDFILSLENTIQPGLISEKIHAGWVTDRVVLYLGEPNIEKYVPKNCFIDLRPYYDYKEKKLNVKGIIERVRNMTQEEYDSILNAVHKWRPSLKNKHNEEKDKLTKTIIERLKGSEQQKENPTQN